ncbi:MAG: aryl-sulfate sulfotransferase [Saprospiraceae bacterium]|nr:aryl-sulfate sulfotransferase [Saprospiraceae bacterium]
MIDYKEEENLNNLFFDVGMEQLQNGNLYFGDKISNTIYEVDFFGNIIHSWPLIEHTFHHNVVEKPNGNFLITTNRPESQHLNGTSTKEDYVIEIDRSTGAIVKEWDFKQLMDENRTVLGPWLDETPIDWIHINAVVYSEVDNTIIISGRHQGIAKIDYQDNVKWILAPHNSWGKNRMNQDCAQFLVAAVNNENVPYDDEVQQGFENAIDFEWPWYQHAPELMPNGNLLVFDNGSERNFSSSNSKYSRAVEYNINEEQKTVQQVWHYGKERGSEAFADVLSDVDYLPKTGNILFAPGMRVLHNGEYRGGRVIEVDYTSQEVYFEAHIGSPGLTFHRVERLSFY